jgi:hypothetical protein
MTPKIPKLDWPDDVEDFECVGFDVIVKHHLIFAIDHNRVKVVNENVTAWYHSFTFDYLGFRYLLETERRDGPAFRHVPYRLTKIAKVDVDDDGNEIIVEEWDAPKTPPPVRYEGSWGSF